MEEYFAWPLAGLVEWLHDHEQAWCRLQERFEQTANRMKVMTAKVSMMESLAGRLDSGAQMQTETTRAPVAVAAVTAGAHSPCTAPAGIGSWTGTDKGGSQAEKSQGSDGDKANCELPLDDNVAGESNRVAMLQSQKITDDIGHKRSRG